MARKPLAELSPAYRRRIERAEAKGLSRQAARGHKVREHIERKQREYRKAQVQYMQTGTAGLTSDQKQAMRRFFLRQIERPGLSEIGGPRNVKAADWQQYRDKFYKLGWPAFTQLRATVAIRAREYRAGYETGMDWDNYDDFLDDYDANTLQWLFGYH